jgi:ABC-type spermidine/putrescine transport system permease subunit I
MEPDFVFDNRERMLTRGFLCDACFVILSHAALAATLANLIAFPASFALAFRAPETVCRRVIFNLIVSLFTSYLVRIYAWQCYWPILLKNRSLIVARTADSILPADGRIYDDGTEAGSTSGAVL